MHETARRGLLRLLGGAAALAVLVVRVLTVVRGCRSEVERISETVDEARDALVERRRDDFLSHFSLDVKYRQRGGRKDLERDVDQWIAYHVGQISILDRTIDVTGTSATIRLRCEVGNVLTGFQPVLVDLAAEKGDDAWRIARFDWKFDGK